MRETLQLNATLLRGRIDAASSEIELRPAIRSYLSLILEHDIAAAAARPSSGEELLLPQIIDRDRVAAASGGPHAF